MLSLRLFCNFKNLNKSLIRRASDLIKFTTEESKGIGILTLDRPKVRNALNDELLNCLAETVKKIHGLDKLRVLVVGSAQPGIFCAGADLKERMAMDNLGVVRASTKIRRIFHHLASLPIPVIAAVDGFALGGGTELALACDLRVASSRAVFGLPETGHAIIPGAGGTQRLQRIIGVSRAKDLIFTGRQVKLEEALQIGLVNYGTDAESCANTDTALEKALEIANAMHGKGPVALRAAKRAIDMGDATDIHKGLKVEETCYLEIGQTEDRLEGLLAFKEKRKPSYKGE